LAVSANIGCSLQIRQHMESQPRPISVRHPVQLLEQSFRGG
jgi:glycolate oxidase iron-sulfur subunit